jgi:NAD(P)-dependent dehydrogenase (short-subunit alcohol dehydrogenase family)
MAVALVTGASRGLGLALAQSLAERGWSLVIDGRDADALAQAGHDLRARAAPGGVVQAVPGDVAHAAHRRALVAAAGRLGGLDVLVNNASTLGVSPLPHLTSYPADELALVLAVNVVAPAALVQDAAPLLRRSPAAAVVNITSDAAVEAYEGWGGYGLSKAALDHMSAVLGVEEPAWRVLAVDPGDLRTQMHQDAFPGEDISDRPLPQAVVPELVRLIEGDAPSGRLSELAAATAERVS